MPSLSVSTVVEAPVDEVWDRIRDFDAIDDILTHITDCYLEGEVAPTSVGAVRNLTANGETIREQLVEHSDLNHYYKYSYLEYPVPVEDRISEIRLLPVTEAGNTLAQWSTHYDVPDEYRDEMIQSTRELYRNGLGTLRSLV